MEQKADVNAKTIHGETALMMASKEDHLPVVQYLVGKGADVHARNNDGKTALDKAKDGLGKQKQAIIDLLNKAMKDPDTIKKQELWDAQLKALKDGGFLTDPAKAGMNAQELAEFKDAITCPISLDIMRDPVRTKTGTKNAQGQEIYTHAYEREDLEVWLKQSPQDPTTRQPKKISDYEPDTDLAKGIQAFMDKHVP